MRRAVLLLLMVAGCSEQLERPEQVRNLRILGMRSEPAEGKVGDELALDVLVTDRSRYSLIETLWLACITPAGGAAPDSCLPQPDAPPPGLCSDDPDATLCAVGFGESQTYRVTPRARLNRAADENGQLVFTTVAALTEEGGLQGCLDQFMTDGVMPVFCRVAVKRVAALPDGATPNQNPGFDTLDVVGDDVTVTLTAGSIEETADGPEPAYLSWFVTEGDLARYRTDADEDGLSNEWRVDPPAGRVFVVIRDGRGGEGWISESR